MFWAKVLCVSCVPLSLFCALLVWCCCVLAGRADRARGVR